MLARLKVLVIAAGVCVAVVIAGVCVIAALGATLGASDMRELIPAILSRAGGEMMEATRSRCHRIALQDLGTICRTLCPRACVPHLLSGRRHGVSEGAIRRVSHQRAGHLLRERERLAVVILKSAPAKQHRFQIQARQHSLAAARA
jgi:hypothetical protein